MSIEPSLQNIGSPSTPTPTIVNGTPSTPAITMVVVPEAPIITMDRPIVNSQATASSPFGSLGNSLSYNVQSIPMDSSPFFMVCPTSFRSFQTPSQLLLSD